MKSLRYFVAAALMATAGVAAAQNAPAPQRGDRNADVTRQQVIERTDAAFARLDVNGDGRFTREEAQQLREQRRTRMAERMFERLDLNRDGSITREEMSQAHAQRRAQRAERRAERGPGARGHRGFRGPRHGMRGARLLGEQGFVTREQFRARALERFDRLDANRDGTLTAAERQAARAQWRERARQARPAPAAPAQ